MKGLNRRSYFYLEWIWTNVIVFIEKDGNCETIKMEKNLHSILTASLAPNSSQSGSEVFSFIDNYQEAQSCSSTWSWITMRNKFLSGATMISCFLLLTLKNVRSLLGSISLTTDLAFFASSVTLEAYCLGFESLLLDDIVDLRNLPVSSTIRRPYTPGWLLILAILSSTSAIWWNF